MRPGKLSFSFASLLVLSAAVFAPSLMSADGTKQVYQVNANTEFNLAAPGVLGSRAARTARAVLLTPPIHAAAFHLNEDGSFSYRPELGFVGKDHFAFRSVGSSESSRTIVELGVVPNLLSFNCDRAKVVGGFNAVATITLTAPAPAGGAVVSLSTNLPTKIKLPATMKVPEGQITKKFNVKTTTTGTEQTGTVSADYLGTHLEFDLVIKVGGLSSITANPNPMVAGNSSTGTVKITGPAPTGGRNVTLIPANGEITVPGVVTIPKGATSTTFSITPNTSSFTGGSHKLLAKCGSMKKAVILTLSVIREVSMASNLYNPVTLQVPAGTTVKWTNDEAFGHSVTRDVGSVGPDSSTEYSGGAIPFESSYSWQVPANAVVGTKYYYHCIFHGSPGNGSSLGTGMAGVIEVIAG